MMSVDVELASILADGINEWLRDPININEDEFMEKRIKQIKALYLREIKNIEIIFADEKKIEEIAKKNKRFNKEYAHAYNQGKFDAHMLIIEAMKK